MRRKVNNSETHEIKRYYKVPSEKVQEWSDTIENLTKQSDQYKSERDTLIDDLYWYKAKVSRLEGENRDLKHENKALRIQSNIYFDELQESEKQRSEFVTMLNESNNLLSEFSQHIGNKPSSSTYKYFRAKLDELGIKEGE